jgi:phosphoribosyl-ATP pyrophosphohydrolase
MTKHDILQELYDTIQSRRGTDPDASYSAQLMAKGPEKIARKLNEEAVEVLIAALNETPERVVSESADVIYHLLVLWAEAGIQPEDVWAELARRSGTSGIEEKQSRSD